MADKTTQEEEFRESLRDVVAVMTRLYTLTDSLSDLKGMLELALENDAQFRLLMKLVLDTKK